MRLHPVDDGLIPNPDERTLTRRDRGGNRLVDIVNPVTGYCTGVRSPLTNKNGEAVVQPTPTNGSPSGLNQDYQLDVSTGRHYMVSDMIRSDDSAPVGLVVRLTTDGDELLPVTRVRVIQTVPTKTRESERNSGAPVRKAPSVRAENNAAVKAYLHARGYTGTITREIRIAVLDLIAIERSITGVA